MPTSTPATAISDIHEAHDAIGRASGCFEKALSGAPSVLTVAIDLLLAQLTEVKHNTRFLADVIRRVSADEEALP